MTATVWGKPSIVENVTAARAVSSGHLHLCPDGRAGYYGGVQDVESAGVIPSLETCAVLRLDADAFGIRVAGFAANFDFTTQKLVASGGTNIGTYVKEKSHNATQAIVALNKCGQPVNVTQIPSTTTTAAPTTTTAGG